MFCYKLKRWVKSTSHISTGLTTVLKYNVIYSHLAYTFNYTAFHWAQRRFEPYYVENSFHYMNNIVHATYLTATYRFLIITPAVSEVAHSQLRYVRIHHSIKFMLQ